MNFLYSFFCSGNDSPALTASETNAVEDDTPVTLNCAKEMSSIETDISYEWFKDGGSTAIAGESTSQYNIGNQRSAAGTYTCKVVAQNSGPSVSSNSKEIKFYCEYCFHIRLIIRQRYERRGGRVVLLLLVVGSGRWV